MKEELKDLVEYIIHRAEFHAGSDEDEKLANSTETKEMIEQYTNQRVIEELEKLNNSKDDYATIGANLFFRIKELKN